VSGVLACRRRGLKSRLDRDAALAKPGIALAGDLRIGIFERRHHAGDA
jgi:hypothetical protein